MKSPIGFIQVALSWTFGLLLSLLSSSSISAQELQESNHNKEQRRIQLEAFDYGLFEQMLSQSPRREKVRLCGLDKVCMEMWKDGRLAIGRRGKLVMADFDLDGSVDRAILLEQDVADRKDFYILVASTVKTTARTVLADEVVPEVHNVVDFFWDDSRKALVIDTGERIIKPKSTLVMDETPVLMNEAADQIEKVFTWITWNPRSNRVVFSKNPPKLGTGSDVVPAVEAGDKDDRSAAQ